MVEEELVKWETLLVHFILSAWGKPKKVPLLGYMGKTLTSSFSAQASTLHYIQKPTKRWAFNTDYIIKIFVYKKRYKQRVVLYNCDEIINVTFPFLFHLWSFQCREMKGFTICLKHNFEMFINVLCIKIIGLYIWNWLENSMSR